MSPKHIDAVNLGFVRELVDAYLDNPADVPDEWRAFFDSAANGVLSEHPLVQRLRELDPALFASNGFSPAPRAGSGRERRYGRCGA